MNWRTYFEQNRLQRRLIPWPVGITVEPHLRTPLIRSSQRFQVGETGEGQHLKMGAAASGDADYAATIALFIAEEHEHARLLERILAELEAPLLKSHWSDSIFVLVRHLMGLKLELVVLLSAELIAKRYYRALYEGTHDPILRAIFAQICDDEEGHIAFHCDFLGRAWAGQSALKPLADAQQLAALFLDGSFGGDVRSCEFITGGQGDTAHFLSQLSANF